MMLNVKILGTPPEVNALWVIASDGKTISSLLFDCGADTLKSLSHGEILAIDHLFLTHLHMDHVSGFDAFFRPNFQRKNRENHIWGPTGTAAILQHRFQGYWWSHASELNATWRVHDIDATSIHTFRFEAREAFAIMHDEGIAPNSGIIVTQAGVRVAAIPLEHHGLCLGYVVSENEKCNVDRNALTSLGLSPGPWLNQLKGETDDAIIVDGISYPALELRARLLQIEPGDSVAYLTDFFADETQRARIAPYLKGVNTLYAEAQYAREDHALALKYHHSTVDQIATLALLAGVKHYVLLHLSRRYNRDDWKEMLKVAQDIFPSSTYISEWGISDT